jgi:SAM-dependent methyltransferase
VDRAHGMLRLSDPGYARAVMNATQLAIPTGSLDLVILVFVLFHVSDPGRALGEIRRVLRPDGRVGCITWGRELDSPAFRVWTECLDAHGAVEADPAIVTRHGRFDSPDKLGAAFENAGYSSVRAWAEDLAPVIDRDLLLNLRTRMGSGKPRFDSLGAAGRQACVAEAIRRLDRLSSDDFVARGKTVHVVAVA